MIREEKLWWFVRHPLNKSFVRQFGFHQFLSSNFEKCGKILGFSTVWRFGALVVVAADMLCFMLIWLQLDERASQLRQWIPWSKTQRSSKVEFVCSDKFCGNQGVCFERLHDFYFPSMKSSWQRKICPKNLKHHNAWWRSAWSEVHDALMHRRNQIRGNVLSGVPAGNQESLKQSEM